MVESQNQKSNFISTKENMKFRLASSTKTRARTGNFELVSFSMSKNQTIVKYLNTSSHASFLAVRFKNCEHSFLVKNNT